MFKAGAGTNLPGAVKIIARLSVQYLGWIIPLLTAGGFLLLLTDFAKKQLTRENLLYLSIVCLTGLFCVKFAIDRGSSLWVRYLLFIFVIVLPLCTIVMSRYLRKYPYIIILTFLLAAAPPFVSQALILKGSGVTRKAVPGIETLSHWLADSPFRNSPLLLTVMKHQASILPLYNPEIAFRYLIVSDWRHDSHLRDFILTFQPQLLITRDGEQKYIARIEKFFDGQIVTDDRLIYSRDTFKAFDLRGLSPVLQPSYAPTNRYVLVGPDFPHRR
jgi:hypothetical protein